MSRNQQRRHERWTPSDFGILIIAAFIVIEVSSCAAPRQQFDIAWPPAPEQPRISLVEIIQDENYFPQSFWKRVFGSLLGADPSKRLAKPYGVVADATGTVYVTDTILGAVVVFDKNEQKVRTIGDQGPGRLSLPSGIALSDSLLFVSDSKQRRIYCYSTSGLLKSVIGSDSLLTTPAGLVADAELDRLYVVDSGKHCVHVFTMSGKYLFFFGSRGSEEGRFNFPTNITVRNGKIYVMDTMNFRVQIFDTAGVFISKFGSVGNRPGFFARPKGIGLDSDGHIYIADAGFENFQLFNESGEVLMFVGSAGVKPGEFGLPAGLFIGKNDMIYVVEQSNSRVQVFKYLRDKKN